MLPRIVHLKDGRMAHVSTSPQLSLVKMAPPAVCFYNNFIELHYYNSHTIHQYSHRFVQLSPQPILIHFYHSKKKPCTYQQLRPIFLQLSSCPPASGNHQSMHDMNLPILDILCEWNHTTHGLLRSAYFI